MVDEDFNLFKVGTGFEWGIWLLGWWTEVRFLCLYEICCINNLWGVLCKLMIDNESLARLERAKALAFCSLLHRACSNCIALGWQLDIITHI